MPELVKKKETFTVDNVQYDIQRPNQKHKIEAQKVYNRAYRDAIESGAIVRARVESVALEQQIWSEADVKEHDKLQKELKEAEDKIKSGGIKLSEGRKLALQISDLRNKIRELLSKRNSLDANTAEAQAENARFNKLVSLCTVYSDTGKVYFPSYDEYLEKSDSDKVAGEAGRRLMLMLYDVDPNFEASLPENKFLRTYKFVDEKLRFIDKSGKLTDREGRHVDENGRFIRWLNEKDFEYVDRAGRKVDKDGKPLEEEKAQPFLDDDGKPVTVTTDKKVSREVPLPANKTTK